MTTAAAHKNGIGFFRDGHGSNAGKNIDICAGKMLAVFVQQPERRRVTFDGRDT